MGSALIYADRRRDGRTAIKKVTGAIRNYAEVPKKKKENKKRENN
jgi:hypothetical protein